LGKQKAETSNIQHRTSNIQWPRRGEAEGGAGKKQKLGKQRAERGLRETFNIEHPASNIQLGTLNLEPRTLNLEKPAKAT
jgi:hypothetical protein